MDLNPLTPFGAEITGLDLAGELDAPAVRGILEAWHRHQVLVFRDQSLSQDDQLRFTNRLGPMGVSRNTITDAGPDGEATQPGIMWVTNLRRPDGSAYGQPHDGEMWFHSDMCYAEKPYTATILYAIELPASGGATLFADMYGAYEALPAATRLRIDGAKVLNVHEYNRLKRPSPEGERTDALQFAHPAVITHPETGRKALFVNRLMSARIEGMEPAQSEALLEELFDCSEDPARILSHVWRQGDLVMWDNRCTIHGRADFPESARRILRRTTVLGARPS
jgi:taurine dioxygenase